MNARPLLVFFAVIVGSRSTWAADCDALKRQLADLDKQLAAIHKIYEKDPTNLDVSKKMGRIIKEIQSTGEKVAVHCTQRTPEPTGVVAPTPTAIPDPQIAVGEKYVLSLSTGRFAFYKRAGDGLAATPTMITSSTLFAGIQKKLNKYLGAHEPRIKAACDPDHPTTVPTDKHNDLSGPPACVTEFYDARATYDHQRKKFWIIAAARNILWRCGDHPGTPGALTRRGSLDQIGASAVGFSSKQGAPKDGVCDKSWDGLARRFVVVAVSKHEDPASGFYTYVAADDYADWPQFTVHDDYMIVNHKDLDWGTSNQFVFNAKEMADGANDGAILIGKELLKLGIKELTALCPDLPPETPLTPITIHGDSDRALYLVANSKDRLLVYGIMSPPGNPTGKPELLSSVAIKLAHGFGVSKNNGVYSAGRIHLTAHECAKMRGDDCVAYGVRVIKFPVWREGRKIHALGPDADDFPSSIDWLLDRSKDGLSLEMPTLEVTDDADMVVVYERQAVDPKAKLIPTTIAYNVFYNGLTGPSDGAVLRRAGTDAIPCVDGVNAPHPGDSSVDLGGAALDPRGGSGHRKTIWMSHAYVDDGGAAPTGRCAPGKPAHYEAAFGAVTP